MFHDAGFFMGGMHALWWLFWIGLVAIIVFYGWGSPSHRRRPPRETPHEVLQRRLAGGEISPEEYDKRKALLDRDGAGKP